jgi:hypothetical protein
LHKDVLKGTRWLLLKNPEHLDPTRDESKRLHEALTLNQPLATAYYLKEDLRRVWEQSDKPHARATLDDWIRRAESSRVPILVRFAHTLAAHRRGILNYLTIASQPDRWKEPTPKSAPCNVKPTAFGTSLSSNSKSMPCTKPAMNWSDELHEKYAKTG